MMDVYYAYNGIHLHPPAQSRSEAIARTQDDPRRFSLLGSRLLWRQLQAAGPVFIQRFSAAQPPLNEDK